MHLYKFSEEVHKPLQKNKNKKDNEFDVKERLKRVAPLIIGMGLGGVGVSVIAPQLRKIKDPATKNMIRLGLPIATGIASQYIIPKIQKEYTEIVTGRKHEKTATSKEYKTKALIERTSRNFDNIFSKGIYKQDAPKVKGKPPTAKLPMENIIGGVSLGASKGLAKATGRHVKNKLIKASPYIGAGLAGGALLGTAISKLKKKD